MPATPAELACWVGMALDGAVMPDSEPVWADGTRASDEEHSAIIELYHYELHRRLRAERIRRRAPARRKALALLRGFLSPEQQRQLRCRGCFDVVAPSGTRYRFWVARYEIEELERHGRRWYACADFCFHPENAEELPAADICLAQLLCLSASEVDFRARANRTDRARDCLWNGDWRRRLNRAAALRDRVGG